MQEKVVILGKGDVSRSFLNICREAGMASTVLEPSDAVASKLQEADIVVQFFEEGSKEISISGELPEGKPQIWLSEVFSSSVTKRARQTEYPQKMVGFSMADPLPEKRFVQLIAGEKTESEAVDKARGFFEGLNFTVVASKDHPGFILNRVVASMINEAIYVYMYGLARMEDIDQMMRLGANFPMGPFEYADFLGLDRVLHTLEWLSNELGPHYRPCPVLRRKVEAGLLGKKTGAGFYTY
jgi:3-hydroxybutyryl-CoA dehydrogenase